MKSNAPFRVAGCSHVGGVRTKNDDWFCIARNVAQNDCAQLAFDESSAAFQNYGLLCAVADGIGGYEGGSRAAQIALQTLGERIYARERGGLSAQEVVELLQADFAEMSRILGEKLRAENLGDAGTTLAGLLILPPDIAVKFWCGDSRILRASGGYVRALTIDHAPLALDVAQGMTSEQAAAHSPLASKISRSLGVKGDGRIECDAETKWERGDRFLLVTDGFHGLGRGLDLASLRAQLGHVEGLDPRARVEGLVAAAVEADGRDNVTLVEVEIS